MTTFSGLEIGLSFVCGCVLLGCAAELYYLLWWKKNGFNPLYEIDINKMRSSPPPTFKFLRDAEEKLLRRLMELDAEKGVNCCAKVEEKDESFVKLVESKSKIQQIHQISAASKVLPLSSSPSNNERN